MLNHWKRRNYLYIQEVYCHVNKLVYIIQYFRPQTPIIADGMIKVTTWLHQ